MPEPKELPQTPPAANPSPIPTPGFHFAEGSNFTHAFVGNNNITNIHYHCQCQHRHSEPEDEKLPETQRPAVRQSSSRTRTHSEPGYPDSPLDRQPTLGRSATASASYTQSVGSLSSKPVGIPPLAPNKNPPTSKALTPVMPYSGRNINPPPKIIINNRQNSGTRGATYSAELPAGSHQSMPSSVIRPLQNGHNETPSTQSSEAARVVMATFCDGTTRPITPEVAAWNRAAANYTPKEFAKLYAPQLLEIIQGRGNVGNGPEGLPPAPDLNYH